VLAYAVLTDIPFAYKLVSTTVSCPLVRAVVWAWSLGEEPRAGISAPPSRQLIGGRRCAGSDPKRPSDWATYADVTCEMQCQIFEVRALEGLRTNGQFGRTRSELGATSP
jgi:hypothetical protein